MKLLSRLAYWVSPFVFQVEWYPEAAEIKIKHTASLTLFFLCAQ